MKAFTKKLVLENGREFYGYGFGADREVIHEIVFNTSVVGYQEIMSDPAYADQMVVMTYPLIGNYGMADEDYETKTPSIGAMIVREYNDQPSNFRYTRTLSEVLEECNIPAIEGLDTRALTRIIRDEGTQKAILTDAATPTEEALARLKAYELPTDSVARVSCAKRWMRRVPNHTYDVVAIDCGIRNTVIRQLNTLNCNVTVLPYNATLEEVMAFHPDGVVISNGPGNPTDVASVIELIKKLRGRLPIFGVGMGLQLIALAYGAKVEKLKVGHRGSNHPVKNHMTGLIETAVQNHGWVVIPETTGVLKVTHTNLLDNTIEGLACEIDRLFAVQFDPTAAEGECHDLFKKFVNLMEEGRDA
ncbi:MAG: glutamine-hydrolyzing carbamoyl-phosphate synthase small subunit [Alistipes sp.]|nr:glutamine-hydrolyzing carbamoyl-phosphate synthase small subunit [Rikenellaceae bacterium]MBQ6881619.1 glutamine-hydrolyzing carbamoyl-phosphate synthase small subunit [Alistipes sp.]MBR3846403.1 glutamine-hydrolyzing carbamoyl-phosphate synthase small subunit [Alistipes sp.]MBR7169340.1 glutamine-hydrolyzing carbamoyl-phosphate synthase small subunit [Alistipes sp.]